MKSFFARFWNTRSPVFTAFSFSICLLLFPAIASAATCTSKASGNWNSATTWNCTSGTTPASGDTVILASSWTVSLNSSNRTAASLTINPGATLNDDNQDLTVNGNVVNNGTFGTNGGALIMRGVNSTLSGTGVFNDTDVQADASGISIPAGSTMSFTNGAQLRVGRDNPGTFTLNGTINGTGLASGDRILRVYQNSSATINGTINAPNAYIRVEQNASLTNNGSVTVQYLDSDGNNPTSVWTQGANSSLTLSLTPTNAWRGTFNASATGNTVTYTADVIPLTPSANTYYNIGHPVCARVSGFTILGSSPCGPVVSSINRASTDPTTPGASVSWTVTFSTSVTGVDTGDFALVTTGGVTGASITGSATGSGTTWTVTANTGSGYGTLGLNLVDNNTIVSSTGGLPLGGAGSGNGNFTGQVYTVSPALTCISDNFPTVGAPNSTNWSVQKVSGTFDPVVVSVGGNPRLRITDITGNVATRVTNKNLFPFGNNLVVAEFDYWAYGGSGADGVAVTFSNPDFGGATGSNANNPPTAGGFGGSLGYANRDGTGCSVAGFSGGWLGVGIDEYGNYSNSNECRNGGPGFRVNAVSIRGSGSGAASPSTTNYYYRTGTAALGANGVSSGNVTTTYRYRITLDSLTDINKVMLLVEQDKNNGNGYATLLNYDLQPDIAAGRQTALPPRLQFTYTGSTGASTNYHEVDNLQICAASLISASGPHHVRIEHSGSGVTCSPSTITIKACADAACSTLYTGGVTGTLTATGTPTTSWSGGSSFTIPASGSVTKGVQVTTPGSVVFGTSGLTPAATGATDCYVGATASCTFTAADAGLVFDVPDHRADVAQSVTVGAVKKADNSLACTPAFASTSKTVNFKCGYTNPGTGTLPVRIGATALNAANNATAACDGSGGNISLSFDASGIATILLAYADAGNMSLTASYTGSGGTETGLVMTGSDSFIVAPYDFGVVTTGPYIAGDPFGATVTARTANGAATPNFGKETTPATATLTHTVTGGTAGTAVTDFTGSLGAFGATTAGVATGASLAWKEVGAIAVTSTLTGGSYLGSGLSVTGTGPAGPFRPAYFETVVTPADATFTYSGQPYTVQITAKSNWPGNPATTNYDNVLGYARAVTLTDANSATNNSASLGTFSNASVLASSFSAGVASVNNVTYTFTTKATAPLEVRPGSLPLAMRATDTDGVSSSGHAEGVTPIRSGRLRLINAYGSELLDSRVEVRAEYWDGSRWTTNTLDKLTTLNSNSVFVSNAGSLTPTVKSLTQFSSGAGGVGYITFNKTSEPGSFDIAYNLNASGVDKSCNANHGGTAANIPWLQGFWAPAANCSSTAAYVQDPNARVKLGSPKAPYIYLRELY